MSGNGPAQLRMVRYGPELRTQLEDFYNTFSPKGAALGLPPRTADGVHEWIHSLDQYAGFVMLDGETVVGHALLCPETYTGEVAVFVRESHRGQGIGKRLLQALIAQAMELDLRRIWGITETDNVPMLRLAHSCGFAAGKELGEFTLDLANAHRLVMPSLEAKG